MEAYLCRGGFIVNLKYDCLVMLVDVIRWRCGQLLSHDFMVYKMKPNVRLWLTFGHGLWLDFGDFGTLGYR